MFLIFAALVVTATVAVPLLADGTVVDLGTALRLTRPAQVAFGILVFPIALLVSQLVCELYGARRNYALGFAAIFASTAIASLAFAADKLTPVALSGSLLVYAAAAHFANSFVFSAMRRAMRGHHLLGRSLLAMATSQVVGQLCFVIAMDTAGEDIVSLRNMASVGAAYACACAVIAIVPLMIIRRLLALYLRMGPTEDFAVDHAAGQPAVARAHRLPPAVLVDDEPGSAGGSGRRAGRVSPAPFSHSELAFFLEGEELSESV